jgi:HPt (histidine-containing phosphotransfer) domain-containing protein
MNPTDKNSSDTISLTETSGVSAAASVAAKIAGSAAASGKVALRGTAEQLKSALTAISGKSSVISAVVTLKGGSAVQTG